MMNSESFHSADFMNCGSIVEWAVPTKRLLTIQFGYSFARLGYQLSAISCQLSGIPSLLFCREPITGNRRPATYLTTVTFPFTQ